MAKTKAAVELATSLPAKVNPRRRVVQSNPILECGYSLSDRAQRLMKLVISQIDDKRDEEFFIYRFSTSQLYKALGLDTTNDSADWLEKALDELMNVKIRIPEHLSSDGAVVLTRMLQKGRIHRRQGWTTVQIDGELKPFFLQIQGRFTKYEIQDVLAFRGEYTIRFYEWFKADQFKATSKSGAWYVTLQLYDMRFRLGMLDKKGKPVRYERWQDFRRYVLDPVAKEISEKSQYLVSWETNQKRNISEVRFLIEPKAKPKPMKAIEQPKKRAPRKPKSAAEKERGKHEKLIVILKQLAEKCSEDLREEIKAYQGEQILKLQKQGRGLLSQNTAEESALAMALEHFEDRIRAEVGK